jgi:ABC-type uncharacterized transport system permease subunit
MLVHRFAPIHPATKPASTADAITTSSTIFAVRKNISHTSLSMRRLQPVSQFILCVASNRFRNGIRVRPVVIRPIAKTLFIEPLARL